MVGPPSLNGLLAYLAEQDVPAVVVGGMAVIVHGYVRATGDVDVVMAEGAETAQWLTRIAHDLEATVDRNGRPLVPAMLSGTDNVGLRTRHGLLDVLIEGSTPLKYAELVAGGITIDFADGTINVVGLAHLRLMKELAGRLQDQLDLEQLGVIHGALPAAPEPAE
jgi:hypothetical protein